GADGLAGMAAERVLDARGGGEVLLRRPLLGWARRADTEGFCRERGIEPRADEMNEDERFARVRVRRRLLPLLETFNPRAPEALARAAALLREDSEALDALAVALLEEARADAQDSGAEGVTDASQEGLNDVGQEGLTGAWPLRAEALAVAAPAVRRRALRLWLARARGDLRRLSHAHLLGVERLTRGTRGGRVAELPGGGRVELRHGLLTFRRET
ncbi:MAG: TilS substrate-binding domain-containing protein, partial [Pyrinomonadaceae bacterium]